LTITKNKSGVRRRRRRSDGREQECGKSDFEVESLPTFFYRVKKIFPYSCSTRKVADLKEHRNSTTSSESGERQNFAPATTPTPTLRRRTLTLDDLIKRLPEDSEARDALIILNGSLRCGRLEDGFASIKTSRGDTICISMTD
jgi:hypothetical protein